MNTGFSTAAGAEVTAPLPWFHPDATSVNYIIHNKPDRLFVSGRAKTPASPSSGRASQIRQHVDMTLTLEVDAYEEALNRISVNKTHSITKGNELHFTLLFCSPC